MKQQSILTIDVGNSCTKFRVWERTDCGKGEIVRQLDIVSGEMDSNLRDSIKKLEETIDLDRIDGVAQCCVGKKSECFDRELEARIKAPLLRLGADTPLPIHLPNYSRESIGADRVAAAVGAAKEGMGRLVVDAGTAITSDLLDGFTFIGGNISPGVSLRFRSLNDYTSRLPRVNASGDLPLFGNSTEEAIRAGVIRGVVAQIADDAQNAATILGKDVQVIITGGDAPLLYPLLADRMNVSPEIDSEIVAKGLLDIFNYNYPE